MSCPEAAGTCRYWWSQAYHTPAGGDRGGVRVVRVSLLMGHTYISPPGPQAPLPHTCTSFWMTLAALVCAEQCSVATLAPIRRRKQ